MIEKIPCKICGSMILPSTSEKTGGYCMPCFRAEKFSAAKKDRSSYDLYSFGPKEHPEAVSEDKYQPKESGPKDSSDEIFPKIEQAWLKPDFGKEPVEPLGGPGLGFQKEAVSVSREGDSKRFIELYLKALEAGINQEYDIAIMYSELAQNYIKLDELEKAVKYFIKCLSSESKPPSGIWQSAMYLYYIYDELGRKDEAQELLELADKANELVNWAHDPLLEADVRGMVKK